MKQDNVKEVAITKRSRPSDILGKLDAACQWAGIEKGRAIQYKKLFEEFFTNKKERTRDHIFVYNELIDLVEIYELWIDEADMFPGIKEKVRAAFSSGPVLREDERVGNSGNRPRNDAFTILFAGKLIKAGVKVVVVEGVQESSVAISDELTALSGADIVVISGGAYVPIECKRPQSKDAIGVRTDEGRKQLNGKDGIIAVDCSVALRPAETILEAPTEKEAAEFLNKRLAAEAKPMAEAELRQNVMGIVLYLRAPVHTIHEISSPVSLKGEPIVTYTQNTASSILCLGNNSSPQVASFKLIVDQLIASIEAKGYALKPAR